ATNASPEQVAEIFSNSRLIGRRFRLVHIFFGREVFEIATFRGNHQDETSTHTQHKSQISHTGQLLRDNIYGDIFEDASRRDFGINSLYYSPSNECIYDFNNALADIRNKEIKL